MMEPKKRAARQKKPIAQPETSLPKRDLFRVDEVAEYFGVTERCIHLWSDHGLLHKEKIRGTVRISRESILNCRFGRKHGVFIS